MAEMLQMSLKDGITGPKQGQGERDGMWIVPPPSPFPFQLLRGRQVRGVGSVMQEFLCACLTCFPPRSWTGLSHVAQELCA